ncbi:MAG TPA: hypothetical protein VNX15_02495 [Gemmatimonadales bacterium]|jgi:hypothetical protein|nr:hypothetical protein [Gemmatimonadales bacterium]
MTDRVDPPRRRRGEYPPDEPPVEHVANALAALVAYRQAKGSNYWDNIVRGDVATLLIGVEARLERALDQLRSAGAR